MLKEKSNHASGVTRNHQMDISSDDMENVLPDSSEKSIKKLNLKRLERMMKNESIKKFLKILEALVDDSTHGPN